MTAHLKRLLEHSNRNKPYINTEQDKQQKLHYNTQFSEALRTLTSSECFNLSTFRQGNGYVNNHTN